MGNQSPNRLKTRMARISRIAYKVLLDRAMANHSSMADELDKALKLDSYQLELMRPSALFGIERLPIAVSVARQSQIIVGRSVQNGHKT